MSLRVCDACDRHAHGQASKCPYCQAELTPLAPTEGSATLGALARIGRAALAIGGATAFSAALVACYGGPTPPRAPSADGDPDVSARTDGGAGTTVP